MNERVMTPLCILLTLLARITQLDIVRSLILNQKNNIAKARRINSASFLLTTNAALLTKLSSRNKYLHGNFLNLNYSFLQGQKKVLSRYKWRNLDLCLRMSRSPFVVIELEPESYSGKLRQRKRKHILNQIVQVSHVVAVLY